MQVEILYAAGGALAGALAALVIYHFAIARPALARLRGLLEVHDGLIGGNGAASDRFALLEKAGDRIAELENRASTDLSRAGFVRYDAFTDGESGLSYALALLNRQGDGVVITSIYSRNDTRTFGKPVAGFKPTVQASAEELEAIERARLPAP
jgi:hypothetical protein